MVSAAPVEATPVAAEARLRHAAPVPDSESVLSEGRSALAFYIPGFLWCGLWVAVWLNWAIAPPTLAGLPLAGPSIAEAVRGSPAAQDFTASLLPYLRMAFFLLALYACWRLARWYLIYLHRYYTFTTQRIKMREGVLTTRTRQIELFRLKDLAVTQSVMGRLFHYAHIRFLSADRLARDEVLPAVPDGLAVADTVRAAAQKARADAGVMQISE